MAAFNMKLHDQNYFFLCSRMSPENFEMLLSWTGSKIKKVTTKMREPKSLGHGLCVTLRYLVTSDTHVTIAASYRMSPTTFGCIIKETCAVIWNVLCDKGYVSPPSSEEAWENVQTGFEQRWKFPNALEAIDGKHVIIQVPSNSSSLYFNYKKTFSIVFIAVCDAKYKFTLADIGDTLWQSDGSVYANSHLGYGLLNIPQPSKIPQSERILPYVFIGDDAFGSKNHLMKPYPSQHLSLAERLFNYRSSRARRVIKNAFEVALSRFRVLHRPVIAKPTTVISTVKTIVRIN